jgi:TonB-linked SusC/RagA family outer membrane protein
MYLLSYIRVISLLYLISIPTLSTAQEITVSGQVLTADGPLPGVNVLIQGTTFGNITDLDGRYTLILPDRPVTLIFSYIGYQTVTETVGDRTIIDVYMQVDATQLDEVVVTGYTTQSKKNISGSISTVDPEDIMTIPANSVTEQLQGRAAGVIVTNSGLPGGVVQVRIRGYGTISRFGSLPLYIIDGTPMNSFFFLESLNPNDVESIQILKDASAASIYGARAGNGVIIITTKAGKASDRPQISFDSYVGVQNFNEFPDFLNPDQLSEAIKLGKENAGLPLNHPQYALSDGNWGLPDYLLPEGHSTELDGTVDESAYDLATNPITLANHEGTEWFDEIFEPAIIQNYNLSVNGGNSNGLYAISLGYFNQEGVLKHTGYKKFTARVNTKFNIRNKIRIGETLGITYQERQNAFAYRMHPVIWDSYSVPNIKPVFDIMGNYTGNQLNGIGGAINPVADLERAKDNDYEDNIQIMGSIFLEWDIFKALTFKTSFNPLVSMTFESKQFIPKVIQNLQPAEASLYQESRNTMNWTWYNTLTYTESFGNSHNFQAMIGTEAINYYRTFFSAEREKYYSQDIDYQQLDAGEIVVDNSGTSTDWSLFSIFGKVDYNFKEKYILSGSVRRDGSSRFGENNRYAIFPAFSAAWRVSGEEFMKGTTVINDLKIRAGWGQSGNQEINDYITYDTFVKNIYDAGYDIRGLQNSAEVGFRIGTYGNPNAKWETTTTTNIGLDITLFKNRLSSSIDLYQRLTTDMLMRVSSPGLAGQPNRQWQNIGEMENKGIDFTIMYQSDPDKDFNWNIGANFTYYKNKVLKLDSYDSVIYSGWWVGGGTELSHIIIEDQPISTYIGYQVLGIFQDTLEVINAPIQEYSWSDDPSLGVGRWKFADVDENDTINSEDRTFIGSPHPDFTIGIPMGFRYKGFDLALFWYGSYGNDVFNVNKRQTDLWRESGTDPYSQKSDRLLHSWGFPGADNSKARLPQINDRPPSRESLHNSYFIEDGSYIRLNQFILGYNFKTATWKGIEKMRIYFQGNNLFTWTNYEGLDPNVSQRDDQLGMDYGNYPNVKSYMLGLNIIFK